MTLQHLQSLHLSQREECDTILPLNNNNVVDVIQKVTLFSSLSHVRRGRAKPPGTGGRGVIEWGRGNLVSLVSVSGGNYGLSFTA